MTGTQKETKGGIRAAAKAETRLFARQSPALKAPPPRVKTSIRVKVALLIAAADLVVARGVKNPRSREAQWEATSRTDSVIASALANCSRIRNRRNGLSVWRSGEVCSSATRPTARSNAGSPSADRRVGHESGCPPPRFEGRPRRWTGRLGSERARPIKPSANSPQIRPAIFDAAGGTNSTRQVHLPTALKVRMPVPRRMAVGGTLTKPRDPNVSSLRGTPPGGNSDPRRRTN